MSRIGYDAEFASLIGNGISHWLHSIMMYTKGHYLYILYCEHFSTVKGSVPILQLFISNLLPSGIIGIDVRLIAFFANHLYALYMVAVLMGNKDSVHLVSTYTRFI